MGRTSGNWSQVLKDSADPKRVEHALAVLKEAGVPFDPEPAQLPVMAALLSGSQPSLAALTTHPEFLSLLTPDRLQYPRRKRGMQKELEKPLKELLLQRDYAGALRLAREFKQREMLRIAARDLGRFGQVTEIIGELSDVADVCLWVVWEVLFLQLTERHGRPWHQSPDGRWQQTTGAVLGMGKLGGQELNYSSDVDVLFVYAEEGAVLKTAPKAGKLPPKTLTNHQFFNRLAEAFIAEVTRITPQGTLYRIDLRLRPEGDSGPLSRSLISYENYYAQWGQTWERMMLIKTRGVAGDAVLGAEFIEMVQPFRYPRSINPSVLREVAALKDRIEAEVVKSGELDRNVKLGRGGIREVEFVVQSQQLLHAGRQPFLQSGQTLPALQKLVQYELVGSTDASALAEGYCFLRKVEHRLQMDNDRQTHTIPQDRASQERLARLMSFPNLKAFNTAREQHCRAIRQVFERTFRAEPAEKAGASPFPKQFTGAEEQWQTLLANHGFKDPAKAVRVLREFVEGPGYIHVSPRTTELALGLVPNLLAMCPQPVKTQANPGAARPGAAEAGQQFSKPPLSDPDRVLTRLDSFIAAYGARSTLFELWNRNPSIFNLLVLLFDRSEFLAELAIRTPDLVDELVSSGRLRQRKTAEETLRDLRHGLEDPDQHLWLRRYHQAELMRIGLRDILGLADPEQYLTELSALADACLQYALEAIMRKHRLKAPPFAIIGLGKLGGAEIDYGSDLDILFVAANKTKDLASVARLAVELMDLVSSRTEQGVLFQTDARLRPDGEKGLLVNSLKAYAEYYRQRAQLWEVQALSRTRPVAGDPKIGDEFQQTAVGFTDLRSSKEPRLNAFSPDWKSRIHHMRMRIEKERTPAGKDELAIKTGAGGLIDAEFIAQTLCMEHGWHEPNTFQALERGRTEGVLPQADQVIAAYRKLRRVEGILRRWSYEGETVLPDDPAPYYRVSVRCGFNSPEDFRTYLREARGQIRAGYRQVFLGSADVQV